MGNALNGFTQGSVFRDGRCRQLVKVGTLGMMSNGGLVFEVEYRSTLEIMEDDGIVHSETKGFAMWRTLRWMDS